MFKQGYDSGTGVSPVRKLLGILIREKESDTDPSQFLRLMLTITGCHGQRPKGVVRANQQERTYFIKIKNHEQWSITQI